MALEHTSERLIEDCYQDNQEDYLIYLFHMIAYQFACDYVEGKKVLDYGCGSGYGAHFLASHGSHVTGIDISQDAIEYAEKNYVASNLSYQQVHPAEDGPLPFEDSSFDVVISFQVIEHVYDIDAYLSEIRRVLVDGGVFLCATPDRETRLFPGQKPWNMWHVHEFERKELDRVLSKYFSKTEVLLQGGAEKVIDIEIRRTRKVRLMTLPVTLPFIPDTLRRSGLKCIKDLKKLLKGSPQPSSKSEKKEYPFNLSDLQIASDLSPSVNLVAVAYK
jgi:2-polyprenyl-3-methyl-5-hydroxy-6-metoxy-1,4-benzoquinol methylase